MNATPKQETTMKIEITISSRKVMGSIEFDVTRTNGRRPATFRSRDGMVEYVTELVDRSISLGHEVTMTEFK